MHAMVWCGRTTARHLRWVDQDVIAPCDDGRRHLWLWPLLHEKAPGSPEKNCSLGMELGHAVSLKHGAHK